MSAFSLVPQPNRQRHAKRLLGVMAALFALFLLITIQPAAAVVPSALSRAQRAALDQVAAYLNDTKTMTARFMQSTSAGNTAEGRVSIRRPGRMAVDYDPPSKIKLIADGLWFIYVDGDVDQVSRWPLSATPAQTLLRDDLHFDDPGIMVSAVRLFTNGVAIDAMLSDDPGQGLLTLVFCGDPLALSQWRTVDAQGLTTTVSLFDIKVGVVFKDPSIFTYFDKLYDSGGGHDR